LQKIKLRGNYKTKMYGVDSYLYDSLLMENFRDSDYTCHPEESEATKDLRQEPYRDSSLYLSRWVGTGCSERQF
jgi:hypothetical protein